MTLKVEGRAVKRGQKRHHFESRFGPLGQISKSGPPRLVNTAVWFETKKDEQRCRSCPIFTALYDQLLLGWGTIRTWCVMQRPHYGACNAHQSRLSVSPRCHGVTGLNPLVAGRFCVARRLKVVVVRF